jgi:chaperonin cofactor prefoldin
MNYLFFDEVNADSYKIMKYMGNVMVIYGLRISELRQELNKNKDTISDFHFILKSPNGKSKTQKYISVNQNAVQMKERDVQEEIQKMKKKIQNEKDKQKKLQIMCV